MKVNVALRPLHEVGHEVTTQVEEVEVLWGQTGDACYAFSESLVVSAVSQLLDALFWPDISRRYSSVSI